MDALWSLRARNATVVSPPRLWCLCQTLPVDPAAEMQFIPLPSKAQVSVAPRFLGSVSIHCIYFFGEIEPKTVLIKDCTVD